MRFEINYILIFIVLVVAALAGCFYLGFWTGSLSTPFPTSRDMGSCVAQPLEGVNDER